MTYEDLITVEEETKRFLKKLDAAKTRIKDDRFALTSGSKETGAVKRAALDLKMELTKITKY
jgi:hypothetical protein